MVRIYKQIISQNFSLKKLIALCVFLGTTIAGAFLSAFPAFAAVHITAYPTSAVFRYFDVCLDSLCILLMIFAVVFIFRTIREYKNSSVSVAFTYFLIGAFLLGVIKVFFILVDDNIWSLHDITLTVGWEILFFLSMITFFIAGRSLAHLVKMNGKKPTFSQVYIWLTISFLVIALVFIGAPFADNYLVKYVQNSWFNTFGVLHLMAFIMTGFVAFSLLRVRNSFHGYIGVIADIYIAIIFISLIHLWELLVENWQVIHVSYNLGELTERIIWVPVFIYILYAFIKLRKMAKSESTSLTQQPSKVIPEPEASQVVSGAVKQGFVGRKMSIGIAF